MSDNMRIWNAVQKTNPANTKKVTQRGGFTAINANSQIMEATRQFGPIGVGWGYTTGTPYFHDTLMFVPVTLWHSGDRSTEFGPLIGCEEWKSDKGRVDSDVGKKATTDAVTKALSQLGFNADVFLGLYDDQKYLAAVTAEFAAKEAETVWSDMDKEILSGFDKAQTTSELVAYVKTNSGPIKASSNYDALIDRKNECKAALMLVETVSA